MEVHPNSVLGKYGQTKLVELTGKIHLSIMDTLQEEGIDTEDSIQTALGVFTVLEKTYRKMLEEEPSE